MSDSSICRVLISPWASTRRNNVNSSPIWPNCVLQAGIDRTLKMHLRESVQDAVHRRQSLTSLNCRVMPGRQFTFLDLCWITSGRDLGTPLGGCSKQHSSQCPSSYNFVTISRFVGIQVCLQISGKGSVARDRTPLHLEVAITKNQIACCEGIRGTSDEARGLWV